MRETWEEQQKRIFLEWRLDIQRRDHEKKEKELERLRQEALVLHSDFPERARIEAEVDAKLEALVKLR